MTFQFTPVMLNEISSRLNTANLNKNYAPVYQYIYDCITDASAYNGGTRYIPKSGVDHSVWEWVAGAKGVNTNDGSYFSNYIRDWTKSEYFHRYGVILVTVRCKMLQMIL